MPCEPIPCVFDGQPCCWIPVGKTTFALVDAEDGPLVSPHNWYLGTKGYAQRNTTVNRRSKSVAMHRVIAGAQPGMDVDHVNHDKLDNRRCNLRIATRSQNMQNRPRHNANSKTNARGVFPERGRFCAKVGINGRQIYIGSFATIAEADAAVREARARLMTHSSECNPSP